MWLLQSIRKDLQWLNARLPAVVKIGLLIALIAFLVKAWWLGSGYWMERVSPRWMTVPRPRIEVWGVVVGTILMTYITFLIDRHRPRR
jgi:hypothetical protein